MTPTRREARSVLVPCWSRTGSADGLLVMSPPPAGVAAGIALLGGARSGSPCEQPIASAALQARAPSAGAAGMRDMTELLVLRICSPPDTVDVDDTPFGDREERRTQHGAANVAAGHL